MEKYYYSQSFLKVQRAWYKKLEKEGFKDAEININGDLRLRQISSHVYKNSSAIERENKLKYFELLAVLVNEKTFDNDLDKQVMTLKSLGSKTNEIAQRLKRHKQTIRYVIRKYENRWGLKKWTPEELDLKLKAAIK